MANLVIFDLDGTLADTMDDITTAINKMLERLGYPQRTKGEVLQCINRGARELVRLSLPENVQNVEFIIDSALVTYGEAYSECYMEKTYAFDGIKEALEGIKERKIKIAVLSNKQDAFVKNICNKLFGEGFFKLAMGQSALPTKPNPQAPLYIAKQLGVKPSKCTIVGDSDIDVLTAKNAGMDIICVSWGYRDEKTLKKAGAKYIVESTEELISRIEDTVKKQNEKKKREKKTRTK